MQKNTKKASAKIHELQKAITESKLKFTGDNSFLNVGFSHFESPFAEKQLVVSRKMTNNTFQAL